MAFAFYVQSVKTGYVRETDAVRLKVTTQCIEEAREREREREKGKNLSRSLPDGNSLQEHKEETSGNTLPWKEDNYSMIQKWPFQKENLQMHHNCSCCSDYNISSRGH